MLTLLPTDTCYGLAGSLTERDYLEIYQLKGRSFAKPLAILVETYEDMKQYIEITDAQIGYLRDYHRPWSCLGKRHPSYILPEWMDPTSYPRLSLRVAENCISPDIGGQILYPLFLTSANISGSSESKTLAEARANFVDVGGIDGGICDLPPSDIIYWEGDEMRWMRKFD